MGQGAVEFVLIAPLFFFIALSILQLAYLAYGFFAVQNAAFAISRHAAASAEPIRYNPWSDIIYSLAPLSRLHASLAAAIPASQCRITEKGNQVQVSLRYPLVIWIPWLKPIFGRKLSPADFAGNPDLSPAETVFNLLKIPMPVLSGLEAQATYARWLTVTSNALDENTLVAPDRTGP